MLLTTEEIKEIDEKTKDFEERLKNGEIKKVVSENEEGEWTLDQEEFEAFLKSPLAKEICKQQ